MKLMRPGEANKRGNIVTARLIPVFLLGIIGYSSWVVTKQVCIDYLLDPAPSLFAHRQVAAAVVILTLYYLLLLVTLVCFTRLLQTITFNPGLVPRGPQYYVERERRRREVCPPSQKEGLAEHSPEGYTPRRGRQQVDDTALRPADFWRRDVFVCGWDGRPPFCSTCYNYKPDRAHHCSELGRCVLKMDHFCPWVGGIISETGFKYFIQFTGWAALFCLHALVFMGYLFAQRRHRDNFISVHWILALVFAALFFLFAAGMCGSSLQLALVNSTTIENFTRKTKVWYVAVYLTPRVLSKYQSAGRDDLRLISYPRPPSEQFELLEQAGARASGRPHTFSRTDRGFAHVTPPPATYSAHAPNPPSPPPAVVAEKVRPADQPPPEHPGESTAAGRPSPEPRIFAILETHPGANPFDLGPLDNFKQVMGYTVLDWLLPLRASPLVDHNDPVSMYKLGNVVYRLSKNAGIVDHESALARDHKGRRRSHRRGRIPTSHKEESMKTGSSPSPPAASV